MKNIIKLLPLLFISMSISAQVGINTTTPKSTLDVNGDINLRNELKVGGTKSVAGNPGTDNQLLVSQGDNATPLWKTSKLSFYEQGEYRITGSNAITDDTGINFGSTSIGDGVPKNAIGENLTTAWSVIDGLTTSLKVSDPTNRINLYFQTGVEMSDVGDNSDRFVRFACGIFLDDKLAALRADQINGIRLKGQRNQSIYTLNYVVNNITPGIHTAKVACRRITSSNTGYNFSIGRSISATNQIADNFMLRSILKFDISELVKIIY
jgi:hypothetical protein